MKIEKFYNKKEKKEQYRTRFQLNKKEFYPTADTRKKLLEMVDEIRANQHRTKYELPVSKFTPTVEELFAEHLSRLEKAGDRKKTSIFKRVHEKFLKIVPAGMKVTELKKAHFQKYIDDRSTEKNHQSKEFILPETINKELSSLSVAFKRAPLYFPELEDVNLVKIPKAKIRKDYRREKMIDKTGELDILLEYLRRAHRHKTVAAARCRIADELEMKYETGLRRSELAALEKRQYRPEEAALRDVKRLKTKTVTKFFPLTRRAVEIIESRLDTDSKYIFSNTGKPNEGDYKTLKYVCSKIDIPYGTFTEGGFVPHDLRHTFATDIIRVTDIETAKSLTGHTGKHIPTYLHTDERRQREAVRRREGIEMKEILTGLYNEIKNGNIDVSSFVEKVGYLIKNG